MEKVLNFAAYIAQEYFSEYGQQIDEMKLHKLMYFEIGRASCRERV